MQDLRLIGLPFVLGIGRSTVDCRGRVFMYSERNYEHKYDYDYGNNENYDFGHINDWVQGGWNIIHDYR